jgi:hypothetical protein
MLRKSLVKIRSGFCIVFNDENAHIKADVPDFSTNLELLV